MNPPDVFQSKEVLMFSCPATGGSIWCRRCTNPNDPKCDNPVNQKCGPNQLVTDLLFLHVVESSIGFGFHQVYKDCIDHALCPSTGLQNFSVNIGALHVAASVKCCDTDECNAQTLPVPAVQSVNHLRCRGCHPTTSKCSCVVHCKGDETVCFNTTGEISTGHFFPPFVKTETRKNLEVPIVLYSPCTGSESLIFFSLNLTYI
uniref:UPAR/Ly6 domain-containing protein n=1 Tax=Salarias fasciatus TaxID=181472 RepID=A0A672HNY5_SALFA